MLNKTAYSEQNNNAKLRSEISLSLCIKEKDRNSEFFIVGGRIKKHIKQKHSMATFALDYIIQWDLFQILLICIAVYLMFRFIIKL